MIVTLIVLTYLAFKTYKGYQTGFTKLIINLIFAAIVFIMAILFQNPLGNWIYGQITGQNIQTTLTPATNLMLFRFLAFFIILFVGKWIIKIFKSWVPNKNPHSTSFGTILDGVLGGIASLFASYFFVYIILSMINALQNPWFIQQTLDSAFIRFIIYNTPILSNGMFNMIFSISRTAA
ncbi:CvpA family protein [Lactobacillus sp. ESL0236]|uniref:CvpA family protein n=1 Tax=unclassified Lactobacillus TaxID=2620435 RepID=UPI000EFB5AD7|nr:MULTISPECIES: CvpA family protein [unclassified Lactobacillus]RMC41889.1 CvpA family protein [Lactobacillus sp. ESL0237]RMC45279.1 CvpA family protein [Lactobacillus sp. ESL0234]RMC46880.1 CvpA family protein [Lactobacillus sp. ESL0236]